ncbi:MAG: class II aldolase/adducin family protein [Rubrivivax sp.]
MAVGATRDHHAPKRRCAPTSPRPITSPRWPADETRSTRICRRACPASRRLLHQRARPGFDEVCASNLVKVDERSRVVAEGGRPPRPVNPPGSRSTAPCRAADVECVVHLPRRAWRCRCCRRPAADAAMGDAAARAPGRMPTRAWRSAPTRSGGSASLGTLDGLVLQNHGTLTVGRTVAEAYMLMYLLEHAAQAQLRAMAAAAALPTQTHQARIIVASDEVAAQTHRQWIGDGSEWDGDVEWPALLRRLDRLSPGTAS